MTYPRSLPLLRIVTASLLAAAATGSAWGAPKQVVVVTDGPVATSQVDSFVSALREVAGSGLEIAEEVPVFEGDWTAEGVTSALERAYAQSPDLVITVGVGASTVAVRQEDAPVPTVAPWVLDPVLQGLTEVPPQNIYPVKIHIGLQRYVDSLRALTGAEDIALLADASGIELLQQKRPTAGLSLVALSDDGSNGWLANLGPEVDAVLVAPLGRLDNEARSAIAQDLLGRGLPSFALGGSAELELGFMMSNVGLGDPTRVARNAALLAVGVLQGRPIKEMNWTPANTGQIAINAETVAALGIAIPFDVLIRASLVGDTQGDQAAERLETVMDLAVANSPELRAAQAEVDAARSDLVRSWSNWMPQAGVSASAAFVDKRLAERSLGQRSPTTVGLDASVNQLIYDVMARAAIPVQQRLQAGRVAGFEARSLDVVTDVALAYVSALRADALIEVRRADLLTLQANLDAARVRVAIGDATDAEEARWQAEIAQARASLVDAYINRRAAQMRVNQRVGRSPGAQFKPDPALADDLLTQFRASVIGQSLDDPLSLRRLADALETIGLERSPELAQLDLGIDAQEAYLGATKRTYFIPRVGANLTGSWDAWRSDGGQASLDLSGLPAGIDLDLPERPDVYGTAGVSASLPIFEGRARKANQSEASYDLTRLEAERQQVEQLLALRIRTSVLNLEGSYQRVNMSEISVQGAERNLDWATDAYGRGLANQVQLLDARAEVLQARVGLTDARFGFLAAILEAKRATALLSHPGNPIDEEAMQRRITALLSEDAE